jgi:hypothetical protein
VAPARRQAGTRAGGACGAAGVAVLASDEAHPLLGRLNLLIGAAVRSDLSIHYRRTLCRFPCFAPPRQPAGCRPLCSSPLPHAPARSDAAAIRKMRQARTVEQQRRTASPPTLASSLLLQCFKQIRGRPRAGSVVCAAVPRDLGTAARQAAGAVLGAAAAASLLLPAMPALAVSGGGGACSRLFAFVSCCGLRHGWSRQLVAPSSCCALLRLCRQRQQPGFCRPVWPGPAQEQVHQG